MIDAKKLQAKLMKHLHAMDLGAMSMMDLSIYSDIVGKLVQMDKPDFAESMAALMATMNTHNGFGGTDKVVE